MTATTDQTTPPRPSEKLYEASRFSDAWYRCVQGSFGLVFTVSGGLRATGLENVPRRGGALLVSNHVSFLDVLALGVSCPRPLSYMARSSLFFPPLGGLIRSVGAFPIEREGVGKQGLIETLNRVKDGRIVLLFPEGTRSTNGEFQPLKPGIAVLVNRAGAPVIPAGVAGTYESWPRHRPMPRPYPLRVHFGEPIQPSELERLDRPAVTATVQERIAAAVAEARRQLKRDLDA